MSPKKTVPLNDESNFSLISGLWKGKKEPFTHSIVLRSTNLCGDGLLDYSDVAEFEVESRQFAQRKLCQGDIIIERSGGGPKQPVGRVGYFDPPQEGNYCTSNFTTVLRIIDRNRFDPNFVAIYLQALYESGATETLQRATTGIRNLDWSEYLKFEIPGFDICQQRAVADLIGRTRRAYIVEQKLIDNFKDIKRTMMRDLFACGLRGEAQKETEIGPVPESWGVVSLGSICALSTGTTPSTKHQEYYNGNIPFIKTGEIINNRISVAETYITKQAVADYSLRIYPRGTVLMAMYGQGKTRGQVSFLEIDAATTQNAAAIQPMTGLNPIFLWHYLIGNYQRLRGMGSLGHLSHLNLGYLRELPVLKPALDEQQEIVEILDAIDQKIDLHKRKKAVLEELFKSLLHKLMTGEIRVTDLDLSAVETLNKKGAA